MLIIKRWEETKTFYHEYILLNIVFSEKNISKFLQYRDFLAELFILKNHKYVNLFASQVHIF